MTSNDDHVQLVVTGEAEDSTSPSQVRSLREKLWETTKEFFPLGYTTFGGPPAHFALFHFLFVEKKKWIDERTFTEIFAMTNALPGPASTQTAFTIALIRNGLLASILSFFLWSGPGMVILLGIAIAVVFIPATLPAWAVMIKSAISAAGIGLISAAGYKLVKKAIKTNVETFICCFAVCAGIVLDAFSWMTPVVIIAGGLMRWAYELFHIRKRRRRVERIEDEDIVLKEAGKSESESIEEKNLVPGLSSIWLTLCATGLWCALLITAFLNTTYLPSDTAGMFFRLLSAFYIGGSIIFGGGPVVIPLLYSYVVSPGWITPQQFLFGLAIVNILPGPNFNFAAYAGGVAWAHLSGFTDDGWKVLMVIIGGIFSQISTFFPGLLIQVAIVPVWKHFRSAKKVMIALDGVSSAAIGLIFSSSFSLWMNLMDMNATEPHSLHYVWEATIAIVAFASTGIFSVFPLWSIVFSVAVALLYYAGTTA